MEKIEPRRCMKCYSEISEEDVTAGECGGTEEVLYCSADCQAADESLILKTHNGHYIRMEELSNGNLRLVMQKGMRKEYAEDIIERKEKLGINQAFIEMMEDFWTNGWYVDTADNAGHMSGTMLIADETTMDEAEGILFPCGKQWIDPNYAINDEVQLIYERGWYEFQPLERYAS